MCFFGIFLFGIVVLIVQYFCYKISDWHDIASMITVCTTMMGSLAFLVKIIAEYVFPKNEDENIPILVEAIQKNDLRVKEFNMEKNEEMVDSC